MFCHVIFPSECFVAVIALERLLPCVHTHVALQITVCGEIVVALVTLEWLFSCVLPHHVNFQIASFYTGKFTHCASVRLFP